MAVAVLFARCFDDGRMKASTLVLYEKKSGFAIVAMRNAQCPAKELVALFLY